MMGLLDSFYRVAEPAAGLLSGAAAEPIAGWGGLLKGGNAQTVNQLREAMTYQPRTPAGKDGMNALAQALLAGKTAMVDNNPPVKAIAEGYHDLADMAGQYNPLLGALFETFPTAAGMAFGPGRSALSSAGRSLAPKAGQMAEGYMLKTGGILPIRDPSEIASSISQLMDKQRRGEKLTIGERNTLEYYRSAAMNNENGAAATRPDMQPPAPNR